MLLFWLLYNLALAYSCKGHVAYGASLTDVAVKTVSLSEDVYRSLKPH